MKRIKKSLLLFLLPSSILVASSSYQEWLDSQQQEYSAYKKSIDEKFANGLKKEWETFKSEFNENPYSKPKPKIVPKTEEPKKKIQKPVEDLPKVKIVPIIEPQPKKAEQPKPITEQKEQSKGENKIKFDFFGSKLELYYDKTIIEQNDNISSPKQIAQYYENLSKTKYSNIINDINQITAKLSLNDWGRYLLTYNIAKEITGTNKNSTNCLVWFLLLKQNFDVKIALDTNKNAILLGNFKENLYQVSYISIDNKRYFMLTPEGKSSKLSNIQTYDISYSNNLTAISPEINAPLAFEDKTIGKQLSFQFNNKKYQIYAKYNANGIEFLKTFPQTEYDVYLKAKEPPYLNNLLEQLKTNIKDMNEIEAVNFLLRFTQNAFEYKTDIEQFSYEKVMLPEETIFYPYSDCEDRSIMFSYLVKTILGLKVVALKFNDHLATAVQLNAKIDGDSLVYKNDRYYIADPTYINADIGMTMPQYKNSKFLVIE